MRGLLAGVALGSLALVVLYVAAQPGTGQKAATGGNLLVAGFRAMFDPGRAGIANHANPTSSGSLHPTTPNGGAGGGGTPHFT